jgi:hypothetical protein
MSNLTGNAGLAAFTGAFSSAAAASAMESSSTSQVVT